MIFLGQDMILATTAHVVASIDNQPADKVLTDQMKEAMIEAGVKSDKLFFAECTGVIAQWILYQRGLVKLADAFNTEL